MNGVESVSTDEVFQVMSGCSSQDPAVLQASSARLKELLNVFGIYEALHEIAAQKAVPLHIRQQAIIQFKNSAAQHWRSRKVISDEQRISIRARTFTFLDEQDDTIAECNEHIVAKIARIDFPTNWRNLVDDLLQGIQATFQKHFSDPVNENAQDTLLLRRSLKLLSTICKEFSSVKMPSGLKTMAMIVSKSQSILAGLYSSLISTYLKNPYPGIISPRTCTDLLLGHLVFKSVSSIATWLFMRLTSAKSEIDPVAALNWIATLVAETFEALKQLTKLRLQIIRDVGAGLKSNAFALRSVHVLTKHIRSIGKFLRRLQELSVLRFSALPCCPDLVAWYWSQQAKLALKRTRFKPDQCSDTTEAPYPVRFLVQGMVLFKENLSQWKPTRRDGVENANALPTNFVEVAVETLIRQFMPLKDAELTEWMNDPEQWVNDEDSVNEQWVFEIRPCSERVLMALSVAFPDTVATLLLNLYNSFGTIPANDLQQVIQKEALYCAIGRCAPKLKTILPFQQWMQTTLAAEAQSTNSVYPIIKRRIAWLLGKLVIADSCIAVTDPLLWQILVHLIRDRGPGSDAVVRLSAAIALRECIDTLEFNIEVFAPFLPDVVSELVKLLGEVDTFEMKRRVDYTLNVVIEQAGERISDLVPIIADPIPRFWLDASENFAFKSTLLETVTKLVEATKQRSTSLHGLVVPLVREGLMPEVASHLDEDALTLWLAALRHTTTLQNTTGVGLVELYPKAVALLATNLDLLGKATDIIVAHLLVDASTILQTSAVDLFRAFVNALSSAAVERNIKDMILALNLLVQLAPSALWGEPMHTSGLFSVLLKTIVEGETKAQAQILMEHILLMSRIVMADPQMFLQLMAATATPNMSENKLYELLLDQWWGTWDNMSEARHRKLSAMGMAALVSTARPDVLERLHGDIFNMWTDVLLELKEAMQAAASDDGEYQVSLHRHWDLDEAPSDYYQDTEGTLEYERRKALYDHDPVRTVKLTAYIAEKLNAAQTQCGPQAFQINYLSKADPAVLAQIQNELAH
ncbi:Importin N-terminal domain-containing protein [Mycena indigotica]|uniref:Importin N-terminal domain-containing protein n=1 Tax=Mycena indigotica TaxID=2126181 RepID=A0A8H6SLV1_9AGAR|nr:Importin N-terminal domain-containing protein [Mycena indigotica]KAF7301791.1 Importin N-terminal domain-containing protein [Mycena indigotica]